MPNQDQLPSQGAGCLLIIIIILGIYQILFASRVLLHNGFNWEVWSLSSIVQVSIAVLWSVLFAHATIRMSKKQVHALGYSSWLIVIFIFSRLIQTILFVQADYDRSRLGFLIMVTLMILAVPILLLIQQQKSGTQN